MRQNVALRGKELRVNIHFIAKYLMRATKVVNIAYFRKQKQKVAK